MMRACVILLTMRCESHWGPQEPPQFLSKQFYHAAHVSFHAEVGWAARTVHLHELASARLLSLFTKKYVA